LALSADESAVFYAGNVAGVRASQKGVGPLGGVQFLKGSGVYQQLAQALVFFIGAIAPVHRFGLGECDHVGHPRDQAGVLNVAGGVEGQALHHGCVHEKLLSLKNVFSKSGANDTPNATNFEKPTVYAKRPSMAVCGDDDFMNSYRSYKVITTQAYAK
jgi:hypothetical protein